jgi:hypothetical protein
MRTAFLSFALIGSGLVATTGAAPAGEGDGCAHFSWDVSHELELMRQAPRTLVAAASPGDATVQIETDHLYELRLAPQGSVKYALPPGKPTLDDSAQGGLVHLRVIAAGLYRVSLTTGHWVDVIAGGQFIKSKDFQGARGCERPHKIVEFELPAGTDLILQFSGATAATVRVAVTPVAPAAGR